MYELEHLNILQSASNVNRCGNVDSNLLFKVEDKPPMNMLKIKN